MTTTTDELAVWLVDGVPARLVWGGIRYRVSDRPTPLEDELFGLTHLDPDFVGWRFQGTAEDRSTRMFDICRRGTGWVLVRVYD